MTNKTKEIQALIQMSRALGVAVDPELERQLKQLQEEKALGLAKQILEKKKQHVEKPNQQPEEIISEHSGLYNFQFSLQVTSSNSATSSVWVWYRKNGADVPRPATHLTISANGGKLAPAWNFVVSMLPEDYFQLMWATNSTNVSLAADPATAFCPSIPAAIVSVTQVNQ